MFVYFSSCPNIYLERVQIYLFSWLKIMQITKVQPKPETTIALDSSVILPFTDLAWSTTEEIRCLCLQTFLVT